MKGSKITVLMLLFLLTLPVTLADDDYEEDRAEFAGLAEAGFVLITIGVLFYSTVKRTSFIDFRKGKISIAISPEMPFLKG
ncbi:MAG: hypothetical protein H0Z18_06345 [Thermococcus sp.]|uniref:hypothetical protein n=1 Tax=Thermococcus sp. TaxID=35749 RepID=UPI001D72E683|nr:hypothetical protein [Thermococcus sp.]MBO8174862.1 hypothetical protein [Thermococcus sp.]